MMQLSIRPSDHQILHAVLRYHYLTARQLTLLRYTYPTSLEHAQRNLKRLSDGGYLLRLFLPRTSQYGSAPSVYTLARPGMRELEALGVTVPARARPARVRTASYLHLTHTLACSEVLIAAEMLAKRDPRVRIAQMLHELDFKRQPTKVTVADEAGQPVTLSYAPDGYLDVVVEGQYEQPMIFEVDRDTEHQAKWRRKLRSILAYHRGPYQRTFGTEYLTICVITTGGQRRLSELLRWTELELNGRGAEDADLFRFTAHRLVETDPADLFLAPRWRRPFDPTPAALLDELDDTPRYPDPKGGL
jgi:hypothetical protein